MAAALEDLRAGEIELLIETHQPYRDVFGEQRTRTRILGYAMIRARGTQSAEYEYMVPTETLFGDIFFATHGTGGPEAAEKGMLFLDLAPTQYLRVEPEKDHLGATRVHFYGGA